MGIAENLKRAARFNPAWKPAEIYVFAKDTGGNVLTDGGGSFIFDLTEETFAFQSYTPDNRVWDEGQYQGYQTLCVITSNPPDPLGLIKLAGVFYQLVELSSGDATGATLHYKATALDTPPPIRRDYLP